MKLPKINNRYASIISVLIIGLIVFNYNRSIEFALIGSSIIFLAFIWNPLGALIEQIWMSISKVMALVMPKIILSIIFFFILTPIALLSRLLKKEDFFNKKNTKDSIWQEEVVDFSPESFKKMW